jgi:predicted transcriptional regulator
MMSQRFNVVISDDLVAEIDKLADKTESTKADVMRKAIQLYIAAQRGAEKGLVVGLANKQTNHLVTEFVGL